MAIRSVRCPVPGARVTRVTDIEGTVTKIICPVYDRPTGACRVMKATLDGGPLSRLLERTVENTLDTRDTQCVLRAG